jgi:type I restriction enzyme S subunit
LLAVTGTSGVVPRDELERRDTSPDDKSKYKEVYVNDIAYNTMRLWQGVVGCSRYEGIVSPAYTVLSPNAGVDGRFYGYLMKTPWMVQRFLQRSQGICDDTNNCKYKSLSPIEVVIPPLPEQCKITRILTTVDNLIETSEALVAKYQAIKQGMMHDLFTRGVDENSHLRPTYDEAPDLYKPSELGWIPKEWESKALNDLVSPNRPIVYGILMPGYGHPGGIPVIKVKDIKNGVVDMEDLLLTSPEIDRQYRRSKTKAEDLLFTIRGTVGRTAFVPQLLDGANITQDTARLGIIEGDARFIRGYLEMPLPARFIAARTLGVAVQGINLGDVRKIPMAYPPPSEQKHIGDVLELQDKRLTDERQFLAKLQTLKAGLMQDLLSGKVRVTVDEVGVNA